MKKMIPWIIASAVIMLVFPWLAVTFVKGDGGMAVCFILFFVLNPIYAIFAGVQASRDVKRFWALPWLHFDMGEPAFLLYALIYLLLGAAAMLLSAFIRKILEKH